MIELIFAIVIISISILAMPTVLFNSAASQEQTLKEEAIMLTTQKIAMILTNSWDPSSSPTNVMSTDQVLNTGGDPDLVRNGITDFRFGHFEDELRRRMTPFSIQRSAEPAIGAGAAINIGTFNGTQETVAATNSLGLKKQYRLDTVVSYVADAADYNNPLNTNIAFNFSDVPVVGTSRNIKMIQVTAWELDNTNPAAAVWNDIIRMNSYASNVGEFEFYKRRY